MKSWSCPQYSLAQLRSSQRLDEISQTQMSYRVYGDFDTDVPVQDFKLFVYKTAGSFSSVTASRRLLGTRVSKPGRNLSLQLPSNAIPVVTVSTGVDRLFLCKRLAEMAGRLLGVIMR